ncbi:hypothetical protein FB547_105318 [Variovorax beijingensis]|uniref:Uncharacterized protein n=1 Tax=Variovorax beijingensis TaxID=2496117 RepID=A0A561C3R1_9BURK|nr:hypothetical protein FB547_105318 [Variovorax beijingensis]
MKNWKVSEGNGMLPWVKRSKASSHPRYLQNPAKGMPLRLRAVAASGK